MAFINHAITYFTIRKKMDVDGTWPIIDCYDPWFHVGKDALPMLLITGNHKLELLGR